MAQIFDPYRPLVGRVLTTSVFDPPFTVPPDCGPCRTEKTFTVKMNGFLLTFTLRDKITPEDPYLVALKAAAFAIKRVEQYRGTPPGRDIRDFLVKQNTVI